MIHISYDQKVFPSRGLVREILGQSAHRIRISPYNELPDFSLKEIAEFYTLVEEGNKAVEGLRNVEEIMEISISFAKKGYQLLREQLETYGLTQIEYSSLFKSEKCMNLGKEKKILLPKKDAAPCLLKMLEGLMGNKSDENRGFF